MSTTKTRLVHFEGGPMDGKTITVMEDGITLEKRIKYSKLVKGEGEYRHWYKYVSHTKAVYQRTTCKGKEPTIH